MDKLLIATVFTAGLACAIPASAQMASPQASQAGAAEQNRHAQRSMQLPSERVEARLAQARSALKITDAQKGLWDNFAAVVRKHALDADKRFEERRARMSERAKGTQPSAIERLERRRQMMATRAQRLDEVLAAGKPLYEAFTSEQKQVADGLLTSRPGRGGPARHRGMRPSA